jgi:hypothetical protein
MKAETLSTGNTNEFTYKVMDIKPQKFWYFWVWSSNKIGLDPINSDPLASSALYRIYFTNPTLILASNNPDPVSMTLYFYRVVLPTFSNGFE